MRNADTTLAIIRERGKRGLDLEDVYRRLFNPDLYLRAYGRIYGNAGAMTEGTTEETVDGMSMTKIDTIIGLLRQECYRWKPVRRLYIPKRDGRQRPLGIPTWSDKLLQEVMRSILDAYYEPQFSDRSHGFRPGRGCHTALRQIYGTWSGTKWFIEGDIKGCFDNIDHQVLLSILREKIHDNRFLTLVACLLKAGYLERWDHRPTLSGTPQGGILSPLLANIYLDRLDKFVEQTLIPEFTKGKARRKNKEYERLRARIERLNAKGAPEEILGPLKRELRQIRSSKDEFDPGYRRLNYIRYADDFLLGVIGPREDAEEIKARVGEFLRDQLKLALSESKTLITNARTDKARFLGYHVSTYYSQELRHRGNGHITLSIPPQVLEERISRFLKNGEPLQRTELINDSDFSIVARYGSDYRGFVQYYALARNRFWLNRLHWVMRRSLFKTLGRKHRTTTRQLIRSGGYTGKTISKTGKTVKCIQIVIERAGKAPLVARFGGISLTPEPLVEIKDALVEQDRLFIGRNEIVQRLLADACELCGSREEVQVHHVRKLADLKVKGRKERPHYIQVMASRRRKTLVVCRECHDAIHAGRPTRMPQSTTRTTGEPGDVKISSPVRRGADEKGA